MEELRELKLNSDAKLITLEESIVGDFFRIVPIHFHFALRDNKNKFYL